MSKKRKKPKRKQFTKPFLSLDDQIAWLRNKGLVIHDDERAKRYLTDIGYYRLKAYWPPFYDKDSNQFHPPSSFDDMLSLYIFDRKLRVLWLDALDRIEIAVRNTISYVMSNHEGPHWYMDKMNFSEDFRTPIRKDKESKFKKFYSLVEWNTGKRNRTGHNHNRACRHYFETYSQPALPPSWVIIETLPMGAWSRVYAGIRKTKYKKQIAERFTFDKDDFEKWVHALTLMRNVCAHHERVWNRKLPARATRISRYTYPGIPLDTPYTNMAIIYAFLRSFVNATRWSDRLAALLQENRLDIHTHMGFPRGWEQEPFWSLKGA